MGYSRENKRQNDALQSILDGNTPEKRIFVAMEDVNEKKERKKEIKLERDKSNERSNALKEARVPWFCPKCDSVMKKRLDDRMWYLYGHCFSCQVKVENKLRIEGKFEEWFRGGAKRVVGTMKDGMMNDFFTFWYHNGNKQMEGKFKDGLVDGKVKIYHDNGKIKNEVEL